MAVHTLVHIAEDTVELGNSLIFQTTASLDSFDSTYKAHLLFKQDDTLQAVQMIEHNKSILVSVIENPKGISATAVNALIRELFLDIDTFCQWLMTSSEFNSQFQNAARQLQNRLFLISNQAQV